MTAPAPKVEGEPVMAQVSDAQPDVEKGHANGVADKTPASESPSKENGAGSSSWKTEVQEIPQNNLWIVYPSLMLTVFLAALDQTITSVALPSIIREIGGASGYSWVGSSYLLMSACVAPIYGKLTTIVGFKPLLFVSIFIFIFGSAMCGASQSFIWLALVRGVQGIGGGGIVPMVYIVTSHIVPMHSRAKYTSGVAATAGVASVIGPLIGGVLTDRASWRWCFWINLPISGICFVLLFLFLHTNPTPKRSWSTTLLSLDWPGLLLIIGGVVCLLLGFEFADVSWQAPQTIALVAFGGVLILLGALNEVFTPKSALMPPRLFTTRTTGGVLVGTFCHALPFYTAAYYVPLYFQILGSDALLSGIQTMPFSVVASIMAVVSGFVVARLGNPKPVMIAGFLCQTVGFGIMILLDSNSSKALQEISILIAGFGLGGNFQPPLIALQAAMPLKDMPTATATFTLLRTLGGAIGISIGNTIYASELARRVRGIQGFTVPSGDPVTGNISSLHDLQPISLRDSVLHAYAKSLGTIWIVLTPISFVGLLSVIIVKTYSLQRAHASAAQAKPESEKPEAIQKETSSQPDTGKVASSRDSGSNEGESEIELQPLTVREVEVEVEVDGGRQSEEAVALAGARR